MQRVTSSPDHVALNATPTEMKSRFSTYEVTWSKVTNPTGSNVVARVINAALAVIKNVAQSVYNAAVFVPNKIHSLLYPNAAANGSFTNEDDSIEIQHDSVLVDVYETDETNGDNDVSPSALEELPEPVVSGTRSRTWLKAGLVGGIALGGATALMIASKRYDIKVPDWSPVFAGENIPGAETLNDYYTSAEGTAQKAFNDAYDAVASLFAKETCSQTVIDGCTNDAKYPTACDPISDEEFAKVQKDFCTGNAAYPTACPTETPDCDLAAAQSTFEATCPTLSDYPTARPLQTCDLSANQAAFMDACKADAHCV